MTVLDIYLGRTHIGPFIGTKRSARLLQERLLREFPREIPTLVYSQERDYPPCELRRLRSIATPISAAFPA